LSDLPYAASLIRLATPTAVCVGVDSQGSSVWGQNYSYWWSCKIRQVLLDVVIRQIYLKLFTYYIAI